MHKTPAIAIPMLLLASPAAAATIDFRDAEFADSNYASEVVYDAGDGVTLTVTPEPQPDASLYWDSTDGFGVRYSYEDDEIEGPEELVISFSEAVYLEEVNLTDLFYESGYREYGSYTLDDGTTVRFRADTDQVPGSTNGEKSLSVGAQVTSISFTAPGTVWGTNHEFSVAGLTYSTLEVPELSVDGAGSSLALLIGAFVVCRRRRAPLV